MDEKFIDIACEYYGTKKNNFKSIPLGSLTVYKDLTKTREKFREQLLIPLDAKVILFFGTIAEYKGIYLLIKVFKKIIETNENVYLLIAGNLSKGINNREFNAELNNDKLRSNVIYHLKYIKPLYHPDYFNISDIVVLPYKDMDMGVSQSGVLLEGLEFSKPIIATNVASLNKGVVNNYNGLLIEKPFESNLLVGLKNLLKISNNELINMGKNSYNIYQNNFSWTHITHKFLELVNNNNE
jgi:glycosyltransferase involved in cell wall biosynthesis